MSTTYTATATREGRWWVIEVEGVGATQVRALRDAADEARDMVAITLDVPAEDVLIDLRPQISKDALEEIQEARSAAEAAATAQALAAGKIRHAASRLECAGLTRADVAVVLGVSPQRVSQLLASLKLPHTHVAESAAGLSKDSLNLGS
ncbi:hypothetical protein [Cellulosimicrobium sp. Marseille-Q8652]